MKLLRYRAVHDDTPRIGALDGSTVVQLEAPSILAWLHGEGRGPAGPTVTLEDVQVLAPFDRAPSFRDFSAFEGHTRNGLAAAARLLPAGTPPPEFPPNWFETPGFYFSNPAAFCGPGEPVVRPEGTRWLDFELEIGGVVGVDGEIAGFMLLNDWSARDVQLHESQLRLGPHKSKDFCTSIGPWFVTPDELPYDGERLLVRASAHVNGELVSHCDASEQHFAWPALLAHAARGTALQVGDVIGSGTLVNGCLMEHGGLPGGRWLEPGDVVELHCEELGTLSTPVV